MAVQTGWVGSGAKAETGKAWMSEARLELQLSKAGWMSEMIGKSTEVVFINTVDLTQASIYELMGSPTEASVYIFENTATISAATQGGWALRTGVFPAGSVLRIVNKGYIRGGGGNGGRLGAAGAIGGQAIHIDYPTYIDNGAGFIFGGGGGGGGANRTNGGAGGGGGAGSPAGLGGYGTGRGGAAKWTGRNGSLDAGGAANHVPPEPEFQAGNGGGLGAAGGRRGWSYAGGRGGYSVQTNGNTITWIAVGDRRGSVV